MRFIKPFFIPIVLFFILTTPVFAQGNLPSTAEEALNSLAGIALTLVASGAAVSALVNRFRWLADFVHWFQLLPNDIQIQIKKTLLLIFSAGLSWGVAQLLPFAQELDASGIWSVVVGIFGVSYLTHLYKKSGLPKLT
ncbi:MAG: hypothetical protein AAF485_22580 [Chloroflexota bacterium]